MLPTDHFSEDVIYQEEKLILKGVMEHKEMVR